VPQVDTAEQAERAVQYARYAPEGQRGLSPMWTRVAGTDWDTVIQTANEETVLVVQMESQTAYENLDEIKQVPGIDVIMVGPLDLSATVGTICDTNSPQVQEIMEDVPKRLEGTGLVAATTLGDVAEIQQKVRWGYRFLNVGSALNYGTQVLAGHLKTLRADPRGTR
jgi:2-keto-3-deoxy-L-rhamnonate aldolase RhmA